MTCKLTQGRQLSGCYENFGGLKTVFIANFDDIDAISISGGTVTDITLTGTSTNFYQFDLHEKAETDEFSEELNFEISNAAKSYTQTLTLLFNKYGSDERDIVQSIASTATVVVVKDNNDNYWLMGKTRGCHLDSAETGSGTALSERNGTTLSIVGTEPQPMNYVDNSQVQSGDGIETIASYS